MKKITSLMLVFALIFSMLMVACGGGSEGGAENGGATDNSGNSSEARLISEPLVVLDNEDCKIVITDAERFGDTMIGLKVSYENKSADKTLTFMHNHAAVNGLELAAIAYEDVEPGAVAEENVTVYTSDLAKNGETEYTDIELGFEVQEADGWKAIYEGAVHIYPQGEDKATKFERALGENDRVIIDNEDFTFVVLSVGEHETRGYAIEAFFVNKTDLEIMIAFEGELINGIEIDPFFATSIKPGNSSFNTIGWDKVKFEENGITAVEKIEFTVRVYDNNDYLADDIVNEYVTLIP